ncbi:MAG: hypothetical protein H3Z49_07215 [archaeon]|nr:hypothetical protein [archaeon]
MKDRRVEKVRTLIEDALKMSDEAIMVVSKGRNLMSMADTVWEAYSKVEHSIILLKLDLEDELSQGQKTLEKDSPDVGALLVKTSDSLTDALDNLDSSDLHEALKDSRMARDALKLVLSHLRRGRV